MGCISHEASVNAAPVIASLDCSCAQALASISGALTRRGLRFLQTFDLQDARLANPAYTCPRHGSASCDCQLLVLLVYGEATAPTAMMLHGSDGQTQLSLLDEPGHTADPLIAAVEESVCEIRGSQGL